MDEKLFDRGGGGTSSVNLLSFPMNSLTFYSSKGNVKHCFSFAAYDIDQYTCI